MFCFEGGRRRARVAQVTVQQQGDALDRQLDVARKVLKEQADVLQALAEYDRQPSPGNADP